MSYQQVDIMTNACQPHIQLTFLEHMERKRTPPHIKLLTAQEFEAVVKAEKHPNYNVAALQIPFSTAMHTMLSHLTALNASACLNVLNCITSLVS